MQIFVRAAHALASSPLPRGAIPHFGHIRSGEVYGRRAILGLKAPEEAAAKTFKLPMDNPDHPGIQKVGSRWDCHIKVEPTVTVNGLKSFLKSEDWIPRENLMLIRYNDSSTEKDEFAFEECANDSSTLEECGVKDQDVMLACMGGHYGLVVVYASASEEEDFCVPISSCFETVGMVKQRIHEMTGHPPVEQDIYHQGCVKLDNDRMPLVAIGIVKPYPVKPYRCAVGMDNRIVLVCPPPLCPCCYRRRLAWITSPLPSCL